MNFRDKLLIYVYRKMTENDMAREDLRIKLRHRPADSLDWYEVLREDIHCEVWEEFLSDLVKLLEK